MNRRARKGKIFIRPNRRKIFREQQIANFQSIVERPCKPGADQIVELLVLKKFSQALPADFFSNAGVKNFYLARSSILPRIIGMPLRSIRDLLPNKRRNSWLSAGKANVTAITFPGNGGLQSAADFQCRICLRRP